METNSLKLIPLDTSHLNLLREWNFDKNISEFFPSRFPVSETEQQIWLDNQINSDKKKKLMILDKATNEYAGMIGIMNIDHVNKNCEVGITIGVQKKWGKGLAADALSLVLKFLFDDLNMHIVYAIIFEENTRAIKFFEKMGFSAEGLQKDRVYKNGRYHSLQYMSIKKEHFTS